MVLLCWIDMKMSAPLKSKYPTREKEILIEHL